MNLETTQPGLANKRNLGLLLLFAVLGVLVSLGTYAVAGGFERISLGSMVAVIVLIVPVTILVVTGAESGHSVLLRAEGSVDVVALVVSAAHFQHAGVSSA